MELFFQSFFKNLFPIFNPHVNELAMLFYPSGDSLVIFRWRRLLKFHTQTTFQGKQIQGVANEHTISPGPCVLHVTAYEHRGASICLSDEHG